MRRVSFESQIASYMRPIMAGKIDVSPMGYTFGDHGYTNPQGVSFKPFQDDLGRMVSLTKKRQAQCPSEAHKQGEHPVVRGRAFVPANVCKACPNRLDRGCCALLRAAAMGSLRAPLPEGD